MVNGISKIDGEFLALWNASRAAAALGDSRVPFLMDQFDVLLERRLDYLHDETLHTSFLKKSIIQNLVVVRLTHKNQPLFETCLTKRVFFIP